MPRQSSWVERSDWRELQFAAVAACGILTPGLKATAQGDHLLSHYLPFGQTACAARIMRPSEAAVARVAVLSRRKWTCGTFAPAGCGVTVSPVIPNQRRIFSEFSKSGRKPFSTRESVAWLIPISLAAPLIPSPSLLRFSRTSRPRFQRHEVVAPWLTCNTTVDAQTNSCCITYGPPSHMRIRRSTRKKGREHGQRPLPHWSRRPLPRPRWRNPPEARRHASRHFAQNV